MHYPVMDREGNSYERTAIKEWLRTHTTSPLSRKPLSADHLVENRVLRNAIDEHYEKTGEEQVRTPPPILSIYLISVICVGQAGGAEAGADAEQ